LEVSKIYKRLGVLCEEKKTSVTALCKQITGSSGNLPTWKKGNINPEALAGISEYFDVPTDYLLGIGVFSNWDKILLSLESIYNELRRIIPSGLELDQFDDRRTLIAHLDIIMNYDYSEIKLAKWFRCAVKKVDILSDKGDDEVSEDDYESSRSYADVEITLTPEFATLLNVAHGNEPIEPKIVSLKDGLASFIGRQLAGGEEQDEQLDVSLGYKLIADALNRIEGKVDKLEQDLNEVKAGNE